jgi:hypothetical protein
MWEEIAPYLSAIILIATAGGAVYKWITPALRVKTTVEKHGERLSKLEEHEKRDLEALNCMQDNIKATSRAMLQVVNHFIDGGNNLEGLKKSRDELTDLLMK